MTKPRFSSVFWTIGLWATSQAQNVTLMAATTPAVTKNRLESLEDMGLLLLSSILSPSPSTVSATITPNSLSSVSQSFSSSSSVAKPTKSSDVTTAPAVAPSTTADTGNSSRNIAIVLGTVLATLVLILIGVVIWQCCSHSKRKAFGRRPVTPLDEDEFTSWRQPAPQERPMSQRQWPDRYSNIPAPPPPHRLGAHHRSSSTYGLLPNENPFDDQMYGYNDYPTQRHSSGSANQAGTVFGRIDYGTHRHSADIARQTPVYNSAVNHRHSTDDGLPTSQLHQNHKSLTQSLQERSPTPLFGSGRTTGETDKGPWLPPPRNPRRPHSLPRSPLANEFDFGFERPTKGFSDRYFSGSSGTLNDAHQHF